MKFWGTINTSMLVSNVCFYIHLTSFTVKETLTRALLMNSGWKHWSERGMRGGYWVKTVE